MDIEIDSFRDDEVEVSAQLATKAFSVYEPISPIFSPEFFKYLWGMPGIDRDLLMCARIGEKVVGQVFVLPRKTRVGKNILDVGTIAVVGTDPDFKRKGIARSLMKKGIERAKEKGFHGLTLFTNPPWNAYALYESLGFKTFFTTNMQMKVLDAKVIARALGVPILAPFMKLKSGIKEKPLPDGFKMRGYEERDRSASIALLKERSKDFDYAELFPEQSWLWWQESMSKKLKPRSYVLEKNDELLGTISTYLSGIRAKSKKGEMKIELGSIGNFSYKQGYEEQAQALLARALKDLKQSGAPAASNGFSPTALQSNEFLSRLWKKYGFMKNKDFEQRFMYKSLDQKFDKLESMKSFFYQPF
jgi:ribosomal protein S18 acetylase RimI-like enzyme